MNAIIAAEEAQKAAELAQMGVTLRDPDAELEENNDGEQNTEEKSEAAKEAEKLAAEKAEVAKEAAKLAEENAGSTAVSGRIERALSLIRYRMTGLQYLVGTSDSVDGVNFNLPGFFATVYKYGLVGTLLSYAFYVYCAVDGKGAYRWMAIIILGVSFFSAHTHGTFYMLFYVLMLADGVTSHRSSAE